MPQQKKPKTRNSKQAKKTKQSKLPFFCIVVLLIAVVITIIMVIKNNQAKDEKSKEQQSTESSETEVVPLPEASLIDMNNTENAKVENGTKLNTSSKLAEPKTFKGLTLKDIKLIAEGGVTRLTANVENTSSQNFQEQGIEIVFTNQDGSEYARLDGILPSIDAGQSNQLDAATTADIANAYNFTIQ